MSHEAPQASHAAATLRQQLTAIWGHKRLIAVGLAIGVAASLVMFFLAGPRYSATADVLVRTTSTTPFESGDVVRQISMQTEIEVAESEKVAAFVVKQTASDQTPAELVDGLRVTNPPNTAVLRFDYSANNAKDAAVLANEFAKSYLADRESRTLATVNRLTKVLEDEQITLTARREALDKQIDRTAGDTERAALEAQRGLVLNEVLSIRNRLVETRTLDTTPGDVVQSATSPTIPDGPPVSTLLAVGIVLGLALGIALAWAASLLGLRLSSRADVGAHLGAGVLARMKHQPLKKLKPGAAPKPLTAGDSARALALSLAYGDGDGARAILVVEPRGTDRAQQVAVELATALAEMGRSVALVEADLREPKLLERLPAALSAERVGGRPTQFGAESSWPSSTSYDVAVSGRLSLYPGEVDDNPIEALMRPEVEKFVTQLRVDTDFVLVLAPPLLTAVDGLELVHLLDGVLVVCDTKAVSASDLELTREAVRGVRGKILGAVQVGR